MLARDNRWCAQKMSNSRISVKEPEAPAVDDSASSSGPAPVRDLTTIRLAVLFSKLRKSTMLAYRREFGLTEVEWRIMTHVGESSPLSLNGLADLTILDRGQLSRTVKGMVKRGILTRERKPGGAEIEISLSHEGHNLYAKLVDRVVKRDRILTEGIPEKDIETLRRITKHMNERARKMLDDELALLAS